MKLLFTALFLLGGPVWAVQPCDSTPNPCYSNVDDILGGKRRLLRNDDLFITNFNSSSGYQDLTSLTSALKPGTPTTVNIEDTSKSCTYILPPQAGRLFNTSNSFQVAIYPTAAADSSCTANGQPNLAIHITDAKNPANNSVFPLTDTVERLYFALADFNRDGFDDIIVMNINHFFILSAVDPTNPSKGIQLVANLVNDLGQYTAPKNDLSVGDFNGDGAIDVAFVAGLWNQVGDDNDSSLEVLTVCPAASVSVIGLGCNAPFQILYPHGYQRTLNLGGQAGHIPDPANNQWPSVVSGNFKGIANRKQVVTHQREGLFSGPNYHQFQVIEFGPNLEISVTSTLQIPDSTSGYDATPFLMAAGSLDWTVQTDQVVYADLNTKTDGGTLSVITFDSDLKMTAHPTSIPVSTAGSVSTPIGIAIGRFDPPDSQDGSKDFNQQIALLYNSGPPSSPQLSSWVSLLSSSQANSWTPQLINTTSLASNIVPVNYNPFGTNYLGIGDLQGRSVFLGAPTRVSISGHIQPDLVLAIPPMHIDYVRDIDNLGPTGKPGVVNFTVMPSVPAPGTAFSTQYAFGSTSSTSATSSTTSSYNYSLGGSTDNTVTFGDPKSDFVRAEVKASGKDTYGNSVAKNDNSYQSVTNSLSATTGFADHLFYTASRLNMYYYQVLGEFSCPDGTQSCSPDQRQPVFVQFSGPDLIEKNDIDATTQEWYQPVHEVGNVLSYPWNLSLLQNENPNLIALTADPAPWRSTDTSMTSYGTTWKAGEGKSITTGSTTSHSFDFSTSITGQIKAGIPGIFTVSGKTQNQFNYSNSSSTTKMNTSATSMDASTGIQVNKPQFSDKVATVYNYEFSGYVLGSNSTNIYDQKELKDSDGKPVDFQTAGPMTVAFMADPLRGGAPWWQQAYNKPDVALNHPARWTWTKGTQTATFNQRDVNAPPEDDAFYQMKGLFITEPNAQGPQLSFATAGDQVQIKVRVYNFSLVDMPSNAKVHVQIYGQVFKNASLFGNSFLIGEDVIAPIPGFNSASNQGTLPNWSYASVNFDTTKYSDTQLVFWVVTWMDDGTNMITEMEGHGLTSSPAGQVYQQISNVPVELYSNNVGLYGTYSPFTVAAPSHKQSTRIGAPIEAESLSIKLSGPGKVGSRMKVTITAKNNGTADISNVPILFYLGDPAAGGKPFDIQRIPHLRQQSSISMRTFFIPEQAGQHTIYVQVGRTTAEVAHVSAVAKISDQ